MSTASCRPSDRLLLLALVREPARLQVIALVSRTSRAGGERFGVKVPRRSRGTEGALRKPPGGMLGPERARNALVLGLVLLSSSLVVAGCRVTRLTDEAMAERAFASGQSAERVGDREAAAAAYRDAVRWRRTHLPAWVARIRLERAGAPGALADEIAAWAVEEPESPYPPFLVSRIAPEREAHGALERAWRASGSEFAPLLDARLWDPRGRVDLERVLASFQALTPRTSELDLRTVWWCWELGRWVEVERALEVSEFEPAMHALLLATLQARRDTRQPRLPEAPPAESRWELIRLYLELLGSLGREDEVERILARAPPDGGDLHEHALFVALQAARRGNRQRAREDLELHLPYVISPRLRVRGSLLLSELRGRSPAAAAPLRDAIPWLTSRLEADHVFRALIARGDAEGAARARDEAALLPETGDPGSPTPAVCREEAETLRFLAGQSEWTPPLWRFFRSAPLTERAAALGELRRTEAEAALRLALRHPSAEMRATALQLLKRQPLLPFAEIPADLAHDVDPRVRAAWLLVAVTEGGEVARAAVARAREDPDPYVREVAERQPLP